MKPETERQAMMLADLILRDAGSSAGQAVRPDLSAGLVSVEMQGMTHTLRRDILLNHVAIAKMVADQIDTQAAEINLSDHIKNEVRRHLGKQMSAVSETVRSMVDSYVRRAFDSAFNRKVAGAEASARIDNSVQKIVDGLFATKKEK